MIKITLEFPDIAQAHALLGTLMAQTQPAPAIVVEPTEEVAAPKKKRTRKKKAEPEVVAFAETPAPKPPKGGDPWGGTPELQTIRTELTKYSQKHGFKAARDILKEFEIKRIPELQERLYPNFLERLSQTPPPEEGDKS